MGKGDYNVAIHWFRNGLRLHDNPSLHAASTESKHLLPLFVIDPDAPFCQSVKAGAIRANFVLESLEELKKKLKNENSDLVVVLGKPDKVIPDIASAFNANALFYEQEAAEPLRKVDAEVLKALKDRLSKDGKESCKIEASATHTLHAMEKYLTKCEGHTCPSSYGSFTKVFQSLNVPKEVDDVEKLPSLPDQAAETLDKMFGDNCRLPSLTELGYDESDVKNRARGGYDFAGGEDAALKRMADMTKKSEYIATFEKPKTIPNDDSKPSTTALSTYLKHGCLSPRRFYHELSSVYSKFPDNEVSKPPVSLHGQLMWREYNYLMGYSTPNFGKMVNNPIARQIPWDDDPQLLNAWRNSKTGYPFVDAIMTQLRETGWIHHLARHMVACFLTRGDLWQSWEKGAAVFEELLIDADWSVNNFNWQWLSCTAHFYQYFRCYSPVAFGKKTDKNGDYIRHWLPQFKDMPAKYIYEPWKAPLDVQKKCGVIVGENYPHPIVDHKVASKTNMSRMKEAYDAHKNDEPMPDPPENRPDGETSDEDDSEPPRKTRRT